ncbi:D-Ala-D-Ala carboxypeptidase family metallohydrolase [Parabacteroides sp. OttesenSCG-928-G21]|nr:D-Ala-D-Ala carboxypeptidase family metallohydrolase [Parabacteroides sp. OttesenSCG-928-G21]
MSLISRNFSWTEMIWSETAERQQIRNVPGEREEKALRRLVEEVLQPLRTAYGMPIRISSGYRCPELNKLVGGVASSQHLKGEAADCVVLDATALLAVLLREGILFDQAILYQRSNFLHVSLRAVKNRKMVIVKR